MDHIAIVILTYNGIGLLKKFLPTVINHSGSHYIIIVDNASQDGTVEYIKGEYPQIQCIQHKENYGFAAGYNKALRKIRAKYYVLLNNDVEVTPQWLEPLEELMEGDLAIAACQPKVLSINSREKFDYAGAAGGFIDTFGYSFCRGRIFSTLEEDHGQYNDVIPIFWASGACLFIRSTVFHQLGGFDHRFFSHFEEIDLCWRIQHQWKVYYHGGSHVYHLGGGTIGKHNPHKTYLNFRNNRLMLYKNSKQHYKIRLRGILDGIAALYMLLRGKPKHTMAIIKAQRDFQKMKKAYSPSSHLMPISNVYQGSIIFDYFFRGVKYFASLNQKKIK